MPVVMPLTSAAAATQIISNAMTALNAARERAKGSQDTDLKKHISELYDELLALKAVVIRLTDENHQLQRTIVQQSRPGEKREPELRQVGSANFYFDGDKGPCCQPCYDSEGKLTVLTQPEDLNGGIRRQCVLCNEYFYEKPMDLSPKRLSGRRRPYGWMG
jgi:hypothetical protein